MIVVAGTLSWSCDAGDSDGRLTPSPSPGGPVQIRGGERLGWNQRASSLADLRAHTFLLFVDGRPAALSDSRCGDAAAPDGYDCSGRLPAMSAGAHTLELSSMRNGQQSTRSAPLTVTVMVAQQSPSSTAFDRGADDAARIADGLGTISWLAAVPDGRLLFVEDRVRVRVVDGEVLAHAAYEMDRREGAIVGLAVDPQFDRTRIVYLAHTEIGHSGSATLNISRFREVANILGQRATIVTGLPFAEHGSAPLGVDGAGLVYVALPALSPAMATVSRDAQYSAVVVRFTPDGGVPRIHPHGSPIIASGFAQPTALAIDAATGGVWLAGTHPAWPHSVAVFSIDPPKGSAWPQHPRPGLPEAADRAGFRATSLSVGLPQTVIVASSHLVHRGVLDRDGTIAGLETFRTSEMGTVSSIASGPDGRVYVAVQSLQGMSSAIRRLAPR